MRRVVGSVVLLLAIAAGLLLLGPSSRDTDPGPPLDPLGDGTGAPERADPALVGRAEGPSSLARPARPGLPVLGRVTDEDGRPVPGVRVAARPAVTVGNVGNARRLVEGFRGATPALAPVAETRSEADGTFGLPGLEPATSYVFEALPAPPAVGGSAVGRPRDLHGRPLTLGVVRGSVLRGRVVGREGEGVPALLSAFQRLGPLAWSGPFGRFALDEHATDSEGRFALAAVPDGALYLTVRVPGRVQRSLLVSTPRPDALVIRLFTEDGATVSGTVLDPKGTPVPDAQVVANVFGNAPEVKRGVHGMTTTGPDGRYRIEGLPPAVLISVDAAAPGFHPTHFDAGRRKMAPNTVETVDLLLRPGSTLRGHVRDTDGRPLAGATLQVRVSEPGSFREVVATSGADGAYRLDALEAGWVDIAVRLDGWYVPAQEEGRVVSERASGLRVQIGDGGTEATLDLVLRPGVAVHGRTVTPDGTPLAGVEVRATPVTGRAHGLAAHYRLAPVLAISDGDGAFAFPGLAPGLRWTLLAQGTGHRGSHALPEPLPFGGPVEAVDLVLRPTASIAGRVVDGEGRPAVGVRVALERLPVRVQTVHDGSFRIDELEAGRFDVSVYCMHGRRIADPVPVELAWGETVTDLVLRTPTALPLAGVLVDEDGVPLPFHYVVLTAADATGRLGTGWPTDAEGRFEATVWSPGPWTAEVQGQAVPGTWTGGDTDVRIVHREGKVRDLRIRFVDPHGKAVPHLHVLVIRGDGASTTTETREVAGGLLVLGRRTLKGKTRLRVTRPRDATNHPLNLLPTTVEDVQDAPESKLVVTLESGRSLTGTVLDDDGAPVAGVRVQVQGGEFLARAPSFGTDAEGRFELVGAPVGALRLTVLAAGPWLPVQPLEVGAGTEDVVIRLRRGRDLVVRVLDPDEQPVGGASVLVRGSYDGRPFSRSGRTDERGEFVAPGVSTEGTMKVRVTPPGPNAPWPPAEIQDAVYGNGALVVRLDVAAEIRGTLVDGEGRPVTRGLVSAYGMDRSVGSQHAHVRLDGSSHEFVLGPLQPGPYRVDARVGGEYAPSGPVEIEAPASGVRLVVTRAVELVGRVAEADREGCVVQYFQAGTYAGTTLDDQGRFRFRQLRDAPTTILARRQDTDRYALVADVKPSDGPFEVRLEAGTRIAGRLTGHAVVECAVGLRRGVLQLWAVQDEDGRFAFRAVPPGRYTLEVWRSGETAVVRKDVEAGREDLVIEAPREEDR